MLAVGCREPASDTDFAMVPPQGCWLGDTRAGDKGPDSGVPRVLGPRPRNPVPSRVTSRRRLPEAPPDGPTVAGDVLRATRSASSSVMPDGARPAATATAACTARGSRPVLGAGVVAVRDVADRCRINAPSARDAPGPCRPRFRSCSRTYSSWSRYGSISFFTSTLSMASGSLGSSNRLPMPTVKSPSGSLMSTTRCASTPPDPSGAPPPPTAPEPPPPPMGPPAPAPRRRRPVPMRDRVPPPKPVASLRKLSMVIGVPVRAPPSPAPHAPSAPPRADANADLGPPPSGDANAAVRLGPTPGTPGDGRVGSTSRVTGAAYGLARAPRARALRLRTDRVLPLRSSLDPPVARRPPSPRLRRAVPGVPLRLPASVLPYGDAMAPRARQGAPAH